MMNLDFQLGTVLNVSQTPDPVGNVHPTLHVQAFLDGAVLDIPLAPSGWEQSLPIPGYIVLFVRMGKHQTRIVKIWGQDEDFVRKGNQFGLTPGEVFIQSPTGLGYFKSDKAGRLWLVSGDQATDLLMNSNGFQVNSTRLYVNTQSGIVFEFNTKGEASLQKVSTDGSVTASITIDSSSNLSLFSEKNVTIKASNIFLDGTVYAGVGATDASTRKLFGDVVTSGATGTHPFDLTTGAPIKGSSLVKAAS